MVDARPEPALLPIRRPGFRNSRQSLRIGPGTPAVTERAVPPPDPESAVTQLTIVPFRCRFDTVSSEAGIVSGPQGELCAFEFPGCRGCKFAVRAIRSVEATEDPLLSMIWRGYVHCSQLREIRG